MSTLTRLVTPFAALALAAALGTAPAAASTDPPWRTVATGLDNPRHLTWAKGGLLVAEAGTGGSGPCLVGAEGSVCFGTTGAVTRVAHGRQYRVLQGLPSLAGEGGASAVGPTDVQVTGHKRYALTIGLGNAPDARAQLPKAGRTMGTVVTGSFPSRHARVLGDLAAYEQANDPDGAGADTNPGGLAGGPHAYYVADAGANAVLKVRASGRISTVAVLDSPGTAPAPFPPHPEIPMQSVPTSVVKGPDGALYVSELTGFPFAPGTARIHRIAPDGTTSVYATGLTNVTDLAWYHGSLYAVQLASDGLLSSEGLPSGSLVRVSRDGDHETVAGDLPAPYGVALTRGTAYVTTCAVCADEGSVVAVPLR